MKMSAASPRERGNPRAALAIVGALFGVAFAILLLPGEHAPDDRAAGLSSRMHFAYSELTPARAAQRPELPASSPVRAVRVTHAPQPPAPEPAVVVTAVGTDPAPLITLTPPPAEAQTLPATPLIADAAPLAVMMPPAIEAEDDHAISVAFRQTGNAMKVAIRKTGEGVKAAFTSIPW